MRAFFFLLVLAALSFAMTETAVAQRTETTTEDTLLIRCPTFSIKFDDRPRGHWRDSTRPTSNQTIGVLLREDGRMMGCYFGGTFWAPVPRGYACARNGNQELICTRTARRRDYRN